MIHSNAPSVRNTVQPTWLRWLAAIVAALTLAVAITVPASAVDAPEPLTIKSSPGTDLEAGHVEHVFPMSLFVDAADPVLPAMPPALRPVGTALVTTAWHAPPERPPRLSH
ncbi:MAG: hypothetical protein KIT73_20750 [Burkholderiales bacterium]|nr:hypothetical protein [Burkholderiales bacterium]